VLLDHVVGLIGIGLLLLVFQVNSRNKILWIQVASNLTWTLYYAMAGMYTAAGLIFLAAIRGYVFERYRHHSWVYVVAIAVLFAATMATWKDWTSLLAFIGMVAASTAMWQKNPRHIRTISPLSTPFWMSYNILNHSYLGLAGDLITFSSVMLGICRFDLKPYLQQRFGLANVPETVDTGLAP